MNDRRRGIGRGIAAAALCLLVACGGADDESRGDLLQIESEARSLIATAPIIVTARVHDVSPGRTTQGLHFEDVRLAVARTLKGDVADTLVVEQAAPEGVALDAWRFATGETYLLLLRPSRTETGRHVPVSQGTYLYRNGRLEAVQPGPVADVWDGKSMEEVLMQIEAVGAAPESNQEP